MVSKAAIINKSISLLHREKTPTVINTSWTIARTAPKAKRNFNRAYNIRVAMKAMTTKKERETLSKEKIYNIAKRQKAIIALVPHFISNRPEI